MLLNPVQHIIKTKSLLSQLDQIRKDHGYKGGKPNQWSKHFMKSQKPHLKTEVLQRYTTLGAGTDLPTVANMPLTLADAFLIPIELTDQWHEYHLRMLAEDCDHASLLRRIKQTGIGHGVGVGVTWNPALDPVTLPKKLVKKLRRLGAAVFLFYDALTDLFGREAAVTELLTWKCPEQILRIVDGSISMVRPDLIITEEADGEFGIRVTELESAPANHGLAVALNAGYAMSKWDIVDTFAIWLQKQGVEHYVVCLTHHWVDYVWDQAVFCRALANRGFQAKVVFDCPLQDVANFAQNLWQTVEAPFLSRNNDLIARLDETGLTDFVVGSNNFSGSLPEKACIFRMGYFDNFSSETLKEMQGRQVVNGIQFFLENKAIIAAIHLSAVREWIAAKDKYALELLDQCFAPVYPIGKTTIFHAANTRHQWVLKYGAWDFNNRSWGSRSVVFSTEKGPKVWEDKLREYARTNHPAILQKMVDSVRFRVPYLASDGKKRLMTAGKGRFCTFFLRTSNNKAVFTGQFLTLREGTNRIHGATDAVIAPVKFK